MRLMNHVLKEYIEKFVDVYFDDILIYNKSLHEHIDHLRPVLTILKVNSLFANKAKFPYHVDLQKKKFIQEWPTPTSVGEVRSFHGLTSFYRRFVPNFSTYPSPLNEFVKKDVFFNWVKKNKSLLFSNSRKNPPMRPF